MNTKKLYKLFALTMALVMCVSSLSFAVDVHFCQGSLKSLSFSGKAKNCHEMVTKSPMKNCKHHQQTKEMPKSCSEDTGDCCENRFLEFELDQNQQIQQIDFVVNKPVQYFISAFVYSYLASSNLAEYEPRFVFHKPPLIPKDIPVLIQSFLL